MEARIRSGCWDQEAALTRLCILCRTAACCCRSSGEKSRVSLISVRSCSSAINYLTQEFYKKIIWNSILLLSVKYFIIFEHFKSSVRVIYSEQTEVRCFMLCFKYKIFLVKNIFKFSINYFCELLLRVWRGELVSWWLVVVSCSVPSWLLPPRPDQREKEESLKAFCIDPGFFVLLLQSSPPLSLSLSLWQRAARGTTPAKSRRKNVSA